MKDFDETSVARPVRDGEFWDMPLAQQKRLIKLIARVSEMSYRRGVQQALTLKKNGRLDDMTGEKLCRYRYASLSRSQFVDEPRRKIPVVEMLFTQYGVLTQLFKHEAWMKD